jgi:hypothetical protein
VAARLFWWVRPLSGSSNEKIPISIRPPLNAEVALLGRSVLYEDEQ